MTTSVSNVVPAENVIHPTRQPQPAWHLRRQPVRQRHRERPVARAEPRLLLTESALRHRQLVAQGEGLHIRVPIAHRQQAQQGERVALPRWAGRNSTVGPHAALVDSRATAQTRPTALDTPYTPHTDSDQRGRGHRQAQVQVPGSRPTRCLCRGPGKLRRPQDPQTRRDVPQPPLAALLGTSKALIGAPSARPPESFRPSTAPFPPAPSP